MRGFDEIAESFWHTHMHMAPNASVAITMINRHRNNADEFYFI
jgi:hypothetical protein